MKCSDCGNKLVQLRKRQYIQDAYGDFDEVIISLNGFYINEKNTETRVNLYICPNCGKVVGVKMED